MTRSRRDTSTVLAQVADIDYQMYQTLQSMPLAIQEARSVTETPYCSHLQLLLIPGTRNEHVCQVQQRKV